MPEIPFSHKDREMWYRYMDVDRVLPSVKTHFKTWHDNLLFQEYLQGIAEKLPSLLKDYPAFIDNANVDLDEEVWVLEH
ncbi:LOW QUALITY PROTEIN: hypothetical protein ColTof4_01447 [Colletotrichum tofieldiae]|nr:LOW QUALITY PROTEIN: hypothetical protein ColTof4_01447 [Colletotrichum tofieldiae]